MNLHVVQRSAFAFLLMVLVAAPFALGQSADPRQQAAQLEQQGRDAEAAAIWHSYAEAHPRDAVAYAHEGQLEARAGNLTAAIAAYRKAMTIAPSMQGLRPNLGLVYFKNGDYREAIAIFEPMLKADPAGSNAQKITVLVGMSYYGLAEYASAVPYLKRAASADAQNLNLLFTLAQSCLFAKEYPCVQDAFHRMVALNGESAQADMLMGEAMDAMQDPVGAQKEFRAAVAANPKEPNVHFGLGYLLWTKDQYPEAAEQFQAELVNDPGHMQAMLFLADAEMQMGKGDDALPLLEKVVKLMPKNAMARRDLATDYANHGRNADAIREFEVAIQLNPKDVNAHWRLARLYRTMGRTAEAKAEFARASSLTQAKDEHLVQVLSPSSGGDAEKK
jgi:tetratricopeptide (TPR) repeat protein